MNPLASEIRQKAGITEEQAVKAAQAVSDFLKARTPHLLHEQLDVILNGGTLSDAVKKKFEILRDDVEDAARNLGKKAEEFASDIKKKFT
jgi:predicted thioredoxin/glutaredoxin